MRLEVEPEARNPEHVSALAKAPIFQPLDVVPVEGVDLHALVGDAQVPAAAADRLRALEEELPGDRRLADEGARGGVEGEHDARRRRDRRRKGEADRAREGADEG